MHQEIIGGVKIEGAYLGTVINVDNGDRSVRLDASGSSNGYLGVIKSNYFIGDNQHSFADGTSSIGSGTTISGLGGSGTATFSSVELQSNGRPYLRTHDIKVSIPNGETIYNAIKDSITSQVASQIATALNGYAKTSDLKNYLKKNTDYTYSTAVMTHTTTQGTAIDGRNVLTDVIDYTTSTFNVH